MTGRGGDRELEIYKLLVEMADRVSQRRQTANNFYLSINSLLLGSSAYASALGSSLYGAGVTTLAGLLISALWIRNIESYKVLNEAKFSVINEIERQFTVQPFTEEWDRLTPSGSNKRYKPFHKVEVAVPYVFTLIYSLQITWLVPWRKAWQLPHLLLG